MTPNNVVITPEMLDSYAYLAYDSYLQQGEIDDDIDWESVECDFIQDLHIADSMQFISPGKDAKDIPLRFTSERPWCLQ